MSTFSGLIDEIAGISIDRFNGPNLDSKIFFLSHCHTDHMVGLADAANDLPGPLYLSKVSEVFVRRKFPHLKKLKTLEIGRPTTISIGCESIGDGCDATDAEANIADRKLTVTTIPAGHCPGSVMFMFETAATRVLYTGDFRLNKTNIETITPIRDARNDMKRFDCIYIDSTFLSLHYLTFPTQRQSVDEIVALTKGWLSKNGKNCVVIRPPANYGYEFLLIELAKHFANEIHISSGNAGDYSYLPELDGCYTGCLTPTTRIHFQCGTWTSNWTSKELLCCPSVSENHLRIIRPTAFRWTEWREGDALSAPHKDISETFFVLYSNHSSCTEIKQLIQCINATKVKFNVTPSDPTKRLDMVSAFKRITSDKPEVSPDRDSDPEQIITFSRVVINKNLRHQPRDDNCAGPKIKRRKKEI